MMQRCNHYQTTVVECHEFRQQLQKNLSKQIRCEQAELTVRLEMSPHMLCQQQDEVEANGCNFYEFLAKHVPAQLQHFEDGAS